MPRRRARSGKRYPVVYFRHAGDAPGRILGQPALVPGPHGAGQRYRRSVDDDDNASSIKLGVASKSPNDLLADVGAFNPRLHNNLVGDARHTAQLADSLLSALLLETPVHLTRERNLSGVSNRQTG